ncbi:hypothetical protein ACOME3_000896 [Neoechinorhynchus agilis]
MDEGMDEEPSTTGKGLRFEIRKWNAVAMWAWDLSTDTCAVCRSSIMELCVDCQVNTAADSRLTDSDCTVAWGVCNHAFHYHCISKWLKNRLVCPLDNSEWHFQRVGK